MPIKGARMQLFPVAKCMTTNYYSIIYYHDHSKHINDHLRCRQDNGATCLNCKVDFLLENHRTVPRPHLYFWNASSLVQSLSSSAQLPFTLPALTRALSISLPFSWLFLSFSVPWFDQRQLCDTVRGIQDAGNIKPLIKTNLQKDRHRGTEVHMHVCVW